jgi:ribulose 1,5-bisphosphate carboxylase large subunit-like protein
MPFHVKPGYSKYFIDVYEKAVNTQPVSYLLLSIIGEVFTFIAAYKVRLRGFALAKGFDIMRTSGDNKRVPSTR